MKRWLFLLFLFILLPVSAIVAQVTVTGTVVDEDKEPLIGVSVSIKGTTTGVTTDLDGKFSITVPEGSTITFEYLGMQPESIKITSSTTKLNVVMKADAHVIDEVVVTAMGVKAEKRKLNFAVSSVNADELMSAKTNNFVEALQGRVAGLNVTTQGGSPNASAQMQIRSVASMSTTQNNGPLFVVDGMSLNGGAASMAQLNPNDIENVTVLKGAAASALYGSLGANGVVMVTTKSGKKGKTSVNFSNSVQWDVIYRMPQIQSSWLPGANGITTNKYGIGGWGAEVPEGTKTYDNARNFFKTGFLHKHDLSVTASGDKISTFASMNYSDQTGIIPDDHLEKIGMYLKSTYEVSPTFSMTFMANLYTTKSRDASQSYETTYPSYLAQVYAWPINNDMSNYVNPNRTINWLYEDPFYTPNPDIYVGDWVTNPYLRRHMDSQRRDAVNNIAQFSANWKAFKNFELIGRLGYEHSSSLLEAYDVARFDRTLFTTQEINRNPSLFGAYDQKNARTNNYTINVMARYNYNLTKDLTLEAMIGGEASLYKGNSSSMGGNVFILPDYYNIANLSPDYRINATSAVSRHRKLGFFYDIRADYKGIVSISTTGRNDRPSTLVENSYFYPSVTAGLTFSELFKISNETFSFGKIRANWAKVGKSPYTPYLFSNKYMQRPTLPDGGWSMNPAATVALKNLKPEMMKSWELGVDLRFFNNSTRFDFAYYSTSVNNQIVTAKPSPTSGYILTTTNQGDVTNHGIEMTLEYDVFKTKDFSWTANVNFALNRSKVDRMPEGVEVIENQSTQAGADLKAAAFLGKSITAIIGRDYARTDDGRIIVNSDGTPQIAPSTTMYIGDREPDFRMGVGSNFMYKDWSLSFLFDIRKGGDVANATARSIYSNGMAKKLEQYRNREIIFNGVVKQDDGTYKQNTTPMILTQQNIQNYIVAAASNFIENASYVRLGYVTLGYSFKHFLKKDAILKDLSLSFTGRNLFLLTNYSGSDPQVNFNTSGGSGSMGWDYFSVPNTRNFNFTVNATF